MKMEAARVQEANRHVFGKYILLRKLASGGMGEVFLAKQKGPSGFEKLLVIKRILAHHLEKPDYLDMFFSEARLVSRLAHNNIIQIHEMGEIEGDHYIAMEYVRGKALRDIVDRLRAQGRFLPLAHLIELGIKLCDGLGYAHQARDLRGHPMNIVHRDINPHNVLVSYAGDLKLIDFGIAKSTLNPVHTQTGTIKGKFVYMSPEQSAADPIDRRSDIFSVGIVLYELACLENPFVRQNVVLSLEAIQRQEVAPPSQKRKDATALDHVLLRALAKRPEERYQTAIEMRDDLRRLLREGHVEPADEDIGTFFETLFENDMGEEERLLMEADQRALDAMAIAEARAPTPLALAHEPPTPGPGYEEITLGEGDEEVFVEEEPTMAGDVEDYAARSRQLQAARVMDSEDRRKDTRPELRLKPEFEGPTRSERVPEDAQGFRLRAESEAAAAFSGPLLQTMDEAPTPAGHSVSSESYGSMPADWVRPASEDANTDESKSGMRPVVAPRRPTRGLKRVLSWVFIAVPFVAIGYGITTWFGDDLRALLRPETAAVQDAPVKAEPAAKVKTPPATVEVPPVKVVPEPKAKAAVAKRRSDSAKPKKRRSKKPRKSEARRAAPEPVIDDVEEPLAAGLKRLEKKAADAKPAAPKATPIGIMVVRMDRGASVRLNNRPSRSPGRLFVQKDSGVLTIRGESLGLEEVRLQYRVAGGRITWTKIRSTPWSIVYKGGLSLGKTPQGPVSARGETALSFLRPGLKEPLRIRVSYMNMESQ